MGRPRERGRRPAAPHLHLLPFGPYTIQAAIAGVHAEASSAADTDWAEIVGLYDALARADDSPVIELNRAVAVAMRDGPAAALALARQEPERRFIERRLAELPES